MRTRFLIFWVLSVVNVQQDNVPVLVLNQLLSDQWSSAVVSTVVSRLNTMTQMSVTMMITLVLLVTTVMAMDTRQDGKCGTDNLAPSGKPAKCDHM